MVLNQNADGNYEAPLVIQIEDDLRNESDGTVSVTLLTDPGLTYRVTAGSNDVGTVQVTDDDAFTTSVSLATEYLPTGATTATYYILANPAPASALDVKYEYNYRNASDRLVGPWTQASVTFDVGATIIEISPIANHNNGSIEVRLVANNNYDLGNPSLLATPPAATDALPQLTISAVGADRIGESQELKFSVMASPLPAASKTAIVHVTQTGDFIFDELNRNDVRVRSVMIPITGENAGSAEFSVGLHDDSKVEDDGSITATIQLANNFVLGDYTKTATVTIVDDDSLPLLTINNPNQVSESDESVNFVVTLDTQIDSLEVHYELREPIGDFLATDQPVVEGSQNINFDSQPNADGNYEGTLNIELDNDQTVESNGTVSVTLVSDPGLTYRAIRGSNDVGVVQVTDDDSNLSSQSISVVSLSQPIPEGTDGTSPTTQNITVQLDGGAAATSEISVDYTLAGFGANRGFRPANVPLDVKLASNAPGRTSDSTGRITLGVGESSGVIPLEIIADALHEADELFSITLSNSVGAIIGTELITVFIGDDDIDAQPTVSIARSVSVTETDTNFNSTVAVTLSAVSGRNVVVPYTVSAVSATAGDDYVFTDGRVEFFPDSISSTTSLSKNISFTIKGDLLEENTEQFTISLGEPHAASTLGQNTVATVTITDDDAPPAFPVISFGDLNRNIGEDSGTITIPVTLSNVAINYPIQLDWSIIPGTATTSDYSVATENASPLIISSGTTGQVIIDITNDEREEELESFQVRFDRDSVRNARIDSPHRVNVTIWG